MKHTLLKGSSLLHFQMKNGINNEILGSNFQIEYFDEENVFEINIDLSVNLKVNNKGTNTFLDTFELETSKDTIEYIQVNNERLMKSIFNQLKKADKNAKKIINLFIKSNHRFEVKFEGTISNTLIRKI